MFNAEHDAEPVKQVQSYWKHWQAVSSSATSSLTHRHCTDLDVWALLAVSLAKALPASEELGDTDSAAMSAVAFSVQVLQYPLELVTANASIRCRPTAAAASTAPGGSSLFGIAQQNDPQASEWLKQVQDVFDSFQELEERSWPLCEIFDKLLVVGRQKQQAKSSGHTCRCCSYPIAVLDIVPFFFASAGLYCACKQQ